MIKIKLMLLIILTLTIDAADIQKCDKCTVAKEYMKCSYYVEQKADLSYQNSCKVYADNMQSAGNNGRASWYYIVAGEFNEAIKSGKMALKVGEKYAAEHIAEAYLLNGDEKKAKEYFSMLYENSYDKQMAQKHFDILQKIYPKKFKIESIKNIKD